MQTGVKMLANKEYIKTNIIGQKVKDILINQVEYGEVAVYQSLLVTENDIAIDLECVFPDLEITANFTPTDLWKTAFTEYIGMKITNVYWTESSDSAPFFYWELNFDSILYYASPIPYTACPSILSKKEFWDYEGQALTPVLSCSSPGVLGDAVP